MWSGKQSILLSKIFIVLFLLVLLVVLFITPWVMQWGEYVSVLMLVEYRTYFLISLYCCGALALVLLMKLYRLVFNIGKEEVFVNKNISLLRHISWLCYGAAGVCLVSAIYFFEWLVIGTAAAFMGLIVRIVKNVMQQAIEIKEENEFTI